MNGLLLQPGRDEEGPRSRPGEWERDGRPDHLRPQAIKSFEDERHWCRNDLARDANGRSVDPTELWQLHSIDPKVPRDEQFAAIKSLQDDGIIRHAGLSNVTIVDIKAASKVFKVATVQNRCRPPAL
jgi:pyridoxine 4-dehydrogenase